MASIFNIAKHSKKPAEGEEATLLAMWAGRDADVKTECICVRWSPNDEKLAAGCGDGLVRPSACAHRLLVFDVAHRDARRAEYVGRG